jgi:hypothetical protein
MGCAATKLANDRNRPKSNTRLRAELLRGKQDGRGRNLAAKEQRTQRHPTLNHELFLVVSDLVSGRESTREAGTKGADRVETPGQSTTDSGG